MLLKWELQLKLNAMVKILLTLWLFQMMVLQTFLSKLGEPVEEVELLHMSLTQEELVVTLQVN